LAVEVMESSAGYDREVKVALYAHFGLPETWLMDLEQRLLEVYRKPIARGYAVVRRFQCGQFLAPQVFPELELAAVVGLAALVAGNLQCQVSVHPMLTGVLFLTGASLSLAACLWEISLSAHQRLAWFVLTKGKKCPARCTAWMVNAVVRDVALFFLTFRKK
jgi:hypothetical protein